MSEVKQCQGMYDECLNSSRIAELEAENAKLQAENEALKWELAHYEAGGNK